MAADEDVGQAELKAWTVIFGELESGDRYDWENDVWEKADG